MIYHWSSLLLILSSLLVIQAQNVPTPANIVCYQEVVATNGSYAQLNASLAAWGQRLYQTLGLTGPIELQLGWARVPDRTGFENGCTGPYPNIADLFVHIQTTSADYDSVSAQLEQFIAANRQTSQPNIVCSARSVVRFLPGCGKITSGGSQPNGNSTTPTPAGNSTSAPTEAPSNNGTSNSTTAPTEAPSNNGTSAPSRGPSPTNAPSNETTESSSTGSGSNSTDLSSSSSVGNSSSDSNSTSSSTGDSNLLVAGAGAADQSATGGITFNGASSTSMAGAAIVVPCIMAVVSMFQQ